MGWVESCGSVSVAFCGRAYEIYGKMVPKTSTSQFELILFKIDFDTIVRACCTYLMHEEAGQSMQSVGREVEESGIFSGPKDPRDPRGSFGTPTATPTSDLRTRKLPHFATFLLTF